jgi:hypothetical protein
MIQYVYEGFLKYGFTPNHQKIDHFSIQTSGDLGIPHFKNPTILAFKIGYLKTLNVNPNDYQQVWTSLGRFSILTTANEIDMCPTITN